MSKQKSTKYKDKEVDFFVEMVDKGYSITKACQITCDKFGIAYKDGIRRAFSDILKREKGEKKIKKEQIEELESFLKAKKRKINKKKKTFLITWAQNSTPVHKNFFGNLTAYSKHLNAELLIIAGRYKNPTSVFVDAKSEDWVEEVKPYLDANRHKIHRHLELLSDIKISPTASTPLSGLNGVTGLESCIVGHPRQHLKSLPVLEGYPNKLLLSSGACTLSNYTDSKAGKKGEFHHTLGFIIVELDGEYYHIRQISADDKGNFYDLFTKVVDQNIVKNEEGAEAVVLGDLHLRNHDKKSTKSVFRLLDDFKPKHTLLHDIFDGESINHHETKDPFRLMEKEEKGLDILEDEINYMMEWLRSKINYNLVIVRGNHEDFLDRWLSSADWRKEKNKKAYLKYANIKASGEASKGIIPYLIDKEFKGKIKTLSVDDSYRVLGWELGIHGHIGASGGRASHTQFKNLNTKNITAHGHHPHKEDGHISVGTLTKLRLGYNKGMSNWMHSNCILYPNGKAQLIHFVNGKYFRDQK